MSSPAAEQRPTTTGIVITTPRRYDLQILLHTRGREGQFRAEQVRLAGLLGGEAILDVGCGTGGFALAAAKAVGPEGSVIGIDPSPEMIGRARGKARRSRSRATFETAIVEALPFADETFDVVTMSLVMHQLPSDAFHGGMAEVRRVLKPDGRLFVMDMGGPQDEGRRTAHAPHGHAGGHAGFDLEQVTPHFDRFGFEVVASGPVEFRLIYLERLRWALARRSA